MLGCVVCPTLLLPLRYGWDWFGAVRLCPEIYVSIVAKCMGRPEVFGSPRNTKIVPKYEDSPELQGPSRIINVQQSKDSPELQGPSRIINVPQYKDSPEL